MQKNTHYSNQLNENQLQAVTAPQGPTMVIAGPGSGKTFVITHRINYMIETYKCQSEKILVITFTKSAAEEMKRRYHDLFGPSNVQFGTFHSVFFKILRMTNSDKYDLGNLMSDDEKKKLIEKIYKDTGDDLYDEFIDLFLSHLTLMKNQLIQPKYYSPDGLSKETFLKVYEGYENYKERQGKFDFDDMLVDCYYELIHNEALLRHLQQRYAYILIDEFQDINCAQFEVVKLLAQEHKNLFIVGDDDQSIYQFRGAKPEFLLSFEAYFSPVNKIILNKNYRSTVPILKYSNTLISHNKNRYKKEMLSHKGEGTRPTVIMCEDSKDQADQIATSLMVQLQNKEPLSECAVIYRTNIQARPIIERLMAAHIPFILKDNILTLYDQWMTKDILAYFYAARNPLDQASILQIINRPNRYISKGIIAELRGKEGRILFDLANHPSLSSWQKDYIQELIYHLQCLQKMDLSTSIDYIRKRIGYDKYIKEYAAYRKMPVSHLESILAEIEDSIAGFQSVEEWQTHLQMLSAGIREQSKSKVQEGIILSTMHSAKGLEFKHVYIIDTVDGVIPHNKSLGEKELEEERRLLYVAMTRAKENLSIYVPKMRYQEKVKPSPFLDEMMHQAVEVEEGTRIKHKHYGKGTVLALHNTSARIQFDNGVTRVIDYVYCIKQKLIFREET